MSNVLVTAIGSFSADIVIKKLKEMNNRVVGCDIYPKEWVADAWNVDKFYQAPYASDTDRYMQFIIELCKKEGIKFLIPLTDLEIDVLNSHRGELAAENVIVCISDEDCIEKCRNKFLLYEYLKKCEIPELIETQKLEEVNGYDLKFPVVMKPVDGRSSQGLFFADSAEQVDHLSKSVDIKNYIVQPKIEGSIVTVDVVRQNDRENAVAISRKELLRTANGAGLSVYVFRDEELEHTAKTIAKHLNICGCVNFEFIVTDDNRKFFLECNPRFSGGVEFSCMAGYNCVLNHLRCFENEPIQMDYSIQEMYIARKYEEYITRIVQ